MAKGQSLQDPFLNALRKERVPVSIYLVNGIKLQGQIDSFDQFVVLLRNSVSQMVYKHAISTVVPARNVRLPMGDDEAAGRRRAGGLSRTVVARSQGELFERPGSGERAILVCVGLGHAPEPDRVEEFAALARSAGAQVLEIMTVTRKVAEPRFFIGTGKVEEVRQRIAELGADLVLVDHALSPGQERNLEKKLDCRVLDRSGLILDIFAQRARTFEGKLQVELAQLEHLATRLVRGWTHLERQKGGIGLRGPGETQLETDRRLVARRIKTLNDRLDKVLVQRETTRRERKRGDVPTVALVGYTNAGKSTLFNRLTAANAYAADQLFATLDPTVRRLHLAPGLEVVLADTVGFVRDLPHELVAAFRSTLQEAREADLLLHVIDAADPERSDRIAQVNEVLESIGAQSLPQIAVYNKIDRTGEAPRVETGCRRARRPDLAVGALGAGHRPAARCAAPAARRRPVPLPAAPAAARGPGPGAAVRGRSRAAAAFARRRRHRARGQPAPARARANLPRGGARTSRGIRALCGPGRVSTIPGPRGRGRPGLIGRCASRNGFPASNSRNHSGANHPMAWNDPGRNRSPWGNRPDRGAADLDEALRNLQRKTRRDCLAAAVPAVAAMPAARAAAPCAASAPARSRSCWSRSGLRPGLYKVDAAERAVVTRFGQYAATMEPGLRWHLPWPIESRQIINVESVEGFSDQTRMLTSDENLVDINIAVQYRRAEARAFAFNVRDPESTLGEVSESAIREIVGRSRLDFVLEEGRQEIAALTKELIQRTLDSYQTGIEVTSVNLQGVGVPEQVSQRAA